MLQPPTTEQKHQPPGPGAEAKPEPQRWLQPPCRGLTSLGHDTRPGVRSAVDASRLRQHFGGLQKGMGNQAILRTLSHTAPVLQAKLMVNQPGDPYEQEADRVAEQVMGVADPAPQHLASSSRIALQRKCSCDGVGESCASCKEDEEQLLQRKPVATTGTLAAENAAPPIVHDVLRSPGRPLDFDTRAFFEPRFGTSLEDVRVHADHGAAKSAHAINALAYTVGSHISFAEGHYDPYSSAGKGLLAHELAHVMQQGGGREAIVRRQAHHPNRNQLTQTSHGRVLFVQVERTTNKITFVTESGSLVYDLGKPTEVAAGSYSFAVAVHGNDLTLSASAAVTNFSGFQYRIAPGQPNPADLLRHQDHVSVQVLEGGSIAPSTGPVVDQPAGDATEGGTTSLPVIFTAYPLDDQQPGLPGLSPFTTGTGLGLHNYAFNDLSWLDSPFSSAYWNALVPRSGIPLDRSAVGLNTPPGALPSRLTPSLDTYLQNQAPGDPLTWLNQNRDPIQFQPDPSSPVTRSFTSEELLSIDGLVRRYNVNPASLSSGELQLVREAARIHIGGSTPTAPFTSYSTPGRAVSWTNNRRYIVKVNVDRGAALDVSQPNAFNEGAELVTNVEEAEFLVVGDQSGRIISVQRVENLAGEGSWALRNAGAIRWGGRIVMVAGLVYSGYRIATATPEERPRVVGEEAGGTLGGLGGGALATAGCIAFAIATEGIGLLLCGLAGAVVGGTLGSSAGGAFLGGQWIDNWVQESGRREFEHFKQNNPDATPADYDRLQQSWEYFETWGIP